MVHWRIVPFAKRTAPPCRKLVSRTPKVLIAVAPAVPPMRVALTVVPLVALPQ